MKIFPHLLVIASITGAAAMAGAAGAVAGAAALPAFHATFIAVGLVTTMSAGMFWQLEPKRRCPVSAPVDPL